MNPKDDNKSDKPVIRTSETGASGQPTGNPNEEHITSGPGFFEKLFGFSLNGSPQDSQPGQTPVKPAADKPVYKPASGGTSVPVVKSTTPPPLPTVQDGAAKDGAATDGAAKDGDAKSGDTTSGAAAGDKDKEEKKPSYVFREPEGPLKPHYAHPRAELIFDPEAPTVYMTPDAYKRMCLYVELAPKEVGWLGTISKRPNGDFLIEEVFLVEQEVTSVETELSVQGAEKLVLELLEAGDPGLDKANKLHFWGHSHVRMGTSPSGTDESTMQRFAREGHEFYVRGIFNKLGRGCFDVYYYNLGYRILDVPWAVMDPATGKVLLDRRATNRSWWQGGPSNDRPSGYNYGGSYGPNGGYQSTWKERQEEQAKKQDEQSGLSEFLKRDEATPKPKKFDPLEIDAELRTQVTAEYKAKVKERYFAPFKWFGGGKKDNGDESGGDNNKNGADNKGAYTGDNATQNATSGPDDVGGQVTDGDLIPTGKDIRPGGTPFNDKPGAYKGGASPQQEEKKGFFAWLGSLFESSPTTNQPYQSTPERPRKRCTPQNCNDASHPWSTNYKGPQSNSASDSRGNVVPDDRQ